jgi:hypothetical protein
MYLQEFFEERLALAKKAVQEPAQPKLKLKVSAPEATPRITLRMGSNRSPIDSAAQIPISNGVSEISNNGTTVPKAASQLEAGVSGPGPTDSPTPSTNGGIKNENGYKQLPSAMPISGSQPGTAQNPSSLPLNGNSMLPPSSSYANGPHVNGVGNHSYGQTYTPMSAFDSKWRHPGKGNQLSKLEPPALHYIDLDRYIGCFDCESHSIHTSRPQYLSAFSNGYSAICRYGSAKCHNKSSGHSLLSTDQASPFESITWPPP